MANLFPIWLAAILLHELHSLVSRHVPVLHHEKNCESAAPELDSLAQTIH
jgi:hypothetical protein